MNKTTASTIITLLKEEFPVHECFLNHRNTFELLCAVMLSAQTTDERVNKVTPNLFAHYPTPELLQAADIEELKTIIKSIGLTTSKANNLRKMAQVLVQKYAGEVPNDFALLQELPGVGRKTANVVLAVGFGIPAFAVDTHVYRVSYRLGFRKELDSLLVAEEKLKKHIPKSDWIAAHHLLILFGRNYCKAQNPNCNNCPLKQFCKVIKRGAK